MFSVNPGLVIWTIITFILLLIVLRKFAWKPLLSALDHREQRIRSDLERAEQARHEAEVILEENRKVLARAEEEYRRILNDGRALAEKLKREIIEDANQLTKKMTATAKLKIEHDKQAALQQLRFEVANLAILTAEKIIGETLDETKHRKLVDDLTHQLPNS